MPELPEVETIVQQLNKEITGKVINDIWTDYPKSLKGNLSLTKFSKNVIGQKITKVIRRGKNILIFLENNLIILVHLKLTGHFLIGKYSRVNESWQPPKGNLSDPANSFIHWVFSLSDGRQLALSDKRKFIKIMLLKQSDLDRIEDLKIGIDPLSPEFTLELLVNLLKSSNKSIKDFLLDQKFIAGIGNIYANEILWEAQISPFVKTREITFPETKALHQAIIKILRNAIKHQGTSAQDEAYRTIQGEKGGYSQFLKVYQRENQPCFRCHQLIKRIKEKSRSTFYCPVCQKVAEKCK